MSTSTFSFCCSGLTSTISPSKSESGPDVTLTDSPSWNSTCVRGRSPTAAPVCRIRSTSPCDSGTGFAPAPTKPVTPGRVLDDAPGVVVQIHVDEDVARQHALLGLHLLAVLGLDDLLGRDDDAAERGRWPIESIRCSRLALTLFSCPE